MYEDKLDGRITSEQYDRKAKDTRSRQEALRAKMRDYQAPAGDMRAGLSMMRLTSIACKEFQRQNSREQRKLLGLVVERATWKDGRLSATLHEPFRTLLLSNSASTTKDGTKGTSEPQLEEWLPIVDTFRTFVACPPTEVRAAFQRIQFLAAA